MKFVEYWKRDINYYIKRTFVENKDAGVDAVGDLLIKHFLDKYFKAPDKSILNLLMKECITQQEFDDFIKDYDIEVQGGHKSLLLSYFMKLHPEINYPEYIAPRLSGLMQYYRFKNLKLISHFKKVGKKLREAGIDILMFKGGALRHYAPEFPRKMGDIDFLVPSKKYEQAKNIALSFGFKSTEYWHSIDLYDPELNITVLDIHHKIDLMSDDETKIIKGLFERARKEKVFGLDDVYVPTPEDMLFLTLSNMVKNMIRWTNSDDFIYTIFDINYLIESNPDFDWNVFIQDAKITKTEPQLYIVIQIVNRYLRNKIPVNFENEFNDYSTLYIYNKWFLKRLRKKSHVLYIPDTLKAFYNAVKTLCTKLIKYVNLTPQYLIYKSKQIRNNPKLAKKVLEKQRIIQ